MDRLIQRKTISDADLDEIERKWNRICDDNDTFADLLEMARLLLRRLKAAEATDRAAPDLSAKSALPDKRRDPQ